MKYIARTILFWFPILALGVANLSTQNLYVGRSFGLVAGSFAEVPYISSSHTTHMLRTLKQRKAWGSAVYTDSVIRQSQLIESYYVNPSRMVYLTSDPLRTEVASAVAQYCTKEINRFTLTCLFPHPSRISTYAKVLNQQANRSNPFSFRIFPGSAKALNATFRYDRSAKVIFPKYEMIVSQRETVLNRRQEGRTPSNRLYRLVKAGQERNHLVFVPSSLGGALYLAGVGPIGLYPIEPDFYFPHRTVSALGRYLLFRILFPSHTFRLVISMTATLKGDGKNRLPPAVVIGKARYPLPLVGSGAARVFSGPLSPQFVNGMPFIGIDMGVPARHIVQPPRKYLMTLYGKDIRLDPRLMTVFARDISLVNERQYRAIRAPREVAQFPHALGNRSLEFSGIYEDGWGSPHFYVVIRSSPGHQTLRIIGTVPKIHRGFKSKACVFVDGSRIACKSAKPGAYTFARALPNLKAGSHKVEVVFDRHQSLPGGDRRPVSMLLRYIGFGSERGAPVSSPGSKSRK